MLSTNDLPTNAKPAVDATVDESQRLAPPPAPVPAGPAPDSPDACDPSHALPQPARNRGGAPRGNVNAGKAFLRSTKWPKEAKADEGATLAIRVDVVAALEAKHGSPLPPGMLALIGTMVRHEKRARLAERWLRVEKDPPLADRLRLLDVIGTATDARDKVLRQLGLHTIGPAADSDPWQEFDRQRQLDSLPDPEAETEAPETRSDASAANLPQTSTDAVQTQPLANGEAADPILPVATDHQPQGASS
jgi:hypothetical protein